MTETNESRNNDARGKFKQTIVVTTILILFIVAAIVIATNPPGGSQPVSNTAESAFALARMTELNTPGVDPNTTLRYAPVQDERVYQLFIHEENAYEKGQRITTEFKANVHLTHGSNASPNSVYVQLKNVDMTVKDGDTPKNLEAVGSLMEGIILEGRLEPQMGLGRLIPLVKINPQAGRVLYIVMDLLHYAYGPLPDPQVGLGAMWTTYDKTNQDHQESITLQSTLTTPHAISTKLSQKVQDLPRGTGLAEVELNPTRDIVTGLKGNLNTTFTESDRLNAQHNIAFSLTQTK